MKMWKCNKEVQQRKMPCSKDVAKKNAAQKIATHKKRNAKRMQRTTTDVIFVAQRGPACRSEMVTLNLIWSEGTGCKGGKRLKGRIHLMATSLLSKRYLINGEVLTQEGYICSHLFCPQWKTFFLMLITFEWNLQSAFNVIMTIIIIIIRVIIIVMINILM